MRTPLFLEVFKFPLIQLPRKSEAVILVSYVSIAFLFPLIQLPRKSEVVSVGIHSDITWFPLIQLPRKSEAENDVQYTQVVDVELFPLIQLPRKSEEWGSENLAPRGL